MKQPSDDDIRRCLDQFASPTVGSGSIHGGERGRIIYDASLPYVVTALRDLFAAEANQQAVISSNVTNTFVKENTLLSLKLRRIIDICLDESQHSDGVVIGRIMEVAQEALGITGGNQ